MSRFMMLIGLCCVASLAQAADNGIYLGAGVTQSDYGLDSPGGAQPFDDETSGYKIIVGFRPLDSFGVEGNYVDHGNATVPTGVACIQLIGVPCPDRTNLTAKTASAFAVGYLDLPLVDLFVKAGLNAWQFDGHSTPAFSGFRINESGTEFAWGAGVQARFGSVGARLEYERFKIIEDEELGTISLNLTWTFL
jgi:opacity protein-like surface antigen